MKAHTGNDYQAVRRGHRRHALVHLWDSGGYIADVPHSGGEVQFSLSTGNGNRSGRLTVPGYEWYDLLRPSTYCWVEVTIDLDGSQFPFGQFPVLRAEVDRPRGSVEVSLGDWSYRRAQPMGEAATLVGSTAQTVKSVCEQYMGHVVPGGVFTVTRDDSGGAMVKSPYDLPLGGNVWAALQALCGQAECQLIVSGRATGQIRRWDPAQPVHEDITGTVARERFGEYADEAVNRVIVQLDGSAPGSVSYRSVRTLTTGPYAYDQDGIGEMALVQSVRQPVSSQAAADAESQRIFDRRAGIVRGQSIEVVPTPWIELGDTLSWVPSFSASPRFGMVDAFTFPLGTEGTQRLALRDQTVVAA